MFEKYKQKLISTLRWSEKYTKTDMVYLTSGGSWLVVGYALQIVVSLLLAVAFANLLPQDVFGTYQYVLATAAVIGAFTLSGMSKAMARASAQGKTGVLISGFWTHLKWSSGIAIISASIAAYYFLNANTTLGVGFLAVGAFAPFMHSFDLFTGFLSGRQLFKKLALFGVWKKIIPVISLIATLFFTQNAIILIGVYFLANAVASGLLFLHTIRTFPERIENHDELVSYSKHLSVIKIIGAIGKNIDKVLVWHFLGAAPVAIYTFAQLPVGHLQSIFAQIRPLALPKLAKRDYKVLRPKLLEKVLKLLFLALAIIVPYIIAAPILFDVFFPAYAEAVLYSQILTLSLLAAPFILIGEAFTAHAMKKEQYIIYIGTPLVKAASLFMLLPIFGLWGVIYAVLASQVFAIISQLFFLYISKG